MSLSRRIRRRQQPKRSRPKGDDPVLFKDVDFAAIEARIMSRLSAGADLYGSRDPHVVIADSLREETRSFYNLMERHRAMGLETRVLTVESQYDEAMRRFEAQLEEAFKNIDPIFPRIR